MPVFNEAKIREKGWTMEFCPKTLASEAEDTDEIYYRPFLYGAESGFRRWKREFLLGKVLLKSKLFRRLLGM